MASRITVKQGESATFEVTFVNNTEDILPAGLTADLTIKTNPQITKVATVTNLKATFSLTPAEMDIPLNSYRFNIRLHNADNTYVKYIPGDILIKDPFDD